MLKKLNLNIHNINSDHTMNKIFLVIHKPRPTQDMTGYLRLVYSRFINIINKK